VSFAPPRRGTIRADLLYIFYQVVVLVGAAIQLLVGGKPLGARRVVETLLQWSLLVNVGIAGLLGFYAHAFHAAATAEIIGWPPGSPFQFEVAMANLAFGVLGILCLWLRGGFWAATIIGFALFLEGAAYGHIRDIILNHNYAPGNAGVILYWDIIVPLVQLVLLVAYLRLTSKGSPLARRPAEP
jgi:hypothetical protein